jgi:hypothetical protein
MDYGFFLRANQCQKFATTTFCTSLSSPALTTDGWRPVDDGGYSIQTVK